MTEFRNVKNVLYNPKFQGTLDHICSDMGQAGFALLRVVPVSEWEAVAVFERVPDQGSDGGNLGGVNVSTPQEPARHQSGSQRGEP